MFPYTVTLYNVENFQDKNFKDSLVNHTTILRGVFLSSSKAVKNGATEGGDAVRLFIPMDVDMRDGTTGAVKQYASPAQFRCMEDKRGYWTLEPSRNCFFVKGTFVTDMTMQEIESKCDEVYTVTSVQVMDYGDDMRHFEVGGK